ncbi:MAG: OmpA family protein [Planktomarina sp.]
MKRLSTIITVAIFGAAAIAAYGAALIATKNIEEASFAAVEKRLQMGGFDWTGVETDGLHVVLSGEAPTETERFRAIAAAGSVVEAARVVDNMGVVVHENLAPPGFSIEILRNDTGITLFGLVPSGDTEADILKRIGTYEGVGKISSFLEQADYQPKELWRVSLNFALYALEELDRAKISAIAGDVSITAISDSLPQKARLDAYLLQRIPLGVKADIQVSAPRPIITPYALRFVKTKDRARFDSCSADTPENAGLILTSGKAAGMAEDGKCRIGLGMPSPRWTEAALIALAGVDTLGEGTVSISDADITFIAPHTVPKAHFDRVIADIKSDMPAPFKVTAIRNQEPRSDGVIAGPELSAIKGENGVTQINGNLSGDLTQSTVTTFAAAQFGTKNIRTTFEDHPNLPAGWTIRVMTALEGLAQVHDGTVYVSDTEMVFTGNTGFQSTGADISQIVAKRLGDQAQFTLDIMYQEELDPTEVTKDPALCVAEIIALTREKKITFEPGSANLTPESRAIIDEIADIMRECPDAEIEVSGHTDSQGREEMNLDLSRARAKAVYNTLKIMRVGVKSLTTEGYGESQPIADNSTEEGREANRRIEFRLITPTPVALPNTDDTQTEDAPNE